MKRNTLGKPGRVLSSSQFQFWPFKEKIELVLPKSRLQKLNVCHTYHKYLAGRWSIKAGESERKKCYEIFVIPQGTRISFCFALSRLSANVLRRCWSKKNGLWSFCKRFAFLFPIHSLPSMPSRKTGPHQDKPKNQSDQSW